jgi:hypothetical protein
VLNAILPLIPNLMNLTMKAIIPLINPLDQLVLALLQLANQVLIPILPSLLTFLNLTMQVLTPLTGMVTQLAKIPMFAPALLTIFAAWKASKFLQGVSWLTKGLGMTTSLATGGTSKVISGALSSNLTSAWGSAAGFAGTMSPIMVGSLVIAAPVIGYAIGDAINKRFNISTKIADWLNRGAIKAIKIKSVEISNWNKFAAIIAPLFPKGKPFNPKTDVGDVGANAIAALKSRVALDLRGEKGLTGGALAAQKGLYNIDLRHLNEAIKNYKPGKGPFTKAEAAALAAKQRMSPAWILSHPEFGAFPKPTPPPVSAPFGSAAWSKQHPGLGTPMIGTQHNNNTFNVNIHSTDPLGVANETLNRLHQLWPAGAGLH